jgi:hypothetical protein
MRRCNVCGGGSGPSKPLFRKESESERKRRKELQRELDIKFFDRQEALRSKKKKMTFPVSLPKEFVHSYRNKLSLKKHKTSPKRSPKKSFEKFHGL